MNDEGVNDNGVKEGAGLMIVLSFHPLFVLSFFLLGVAAYVRRYVTRLANRSALRPSGLVWPCGPPLHIANATAALATVCRGDPCGRPGTINVETFRGTSPAAIYRGGGKTIVAVKMK
jgi:hypothetical protein